MEDFRKKLKKDTLIYIGFIVMGVIGFVLMVVFGKNNSGVNSIAGFCGALITISIMFIIRNKKVLGNEKLLKELYIRNTDERNIQIAASSARTSIYLIIASLSIGVIVTGFFSRSVSCALSVCLAVIIAIHLSVMTYYNKKM